MIEPPSTSHIVADANDENTTAGCAIASTTASRKNNSEVMYSGIAPVAHSPTVSSISAAACITTGATPAGGGRKKITAAAMQTSDASREESRGTMASSASTDLHALQNKTSPTSMDRCS